MDNKILNMKMTNFQTESRDMAIFCESPREKVVKLYFYCILIEIRKEFFDLIGWETVRT